MDDKETPRFFKGGMNLLDTPTIRHERNEEIEQIKSG